MSNQQLEVALSLHAARCGQHAVARGEHRFDCGEFDAVAAQLDLRIDPAEVVEFTRGGSTDQIARAVDASKPGMNRELLCSEFRHAAIAACQSGPGDDQLARVALVDFFERPIHDPGGVPSHRSTDGDGLSDDNASADDGHGAFGRAVAVLHPSSCGPAVGEVARQGLAADIQQTQLRKGTLGVVAPGRPEQGRRGTEDGDALAGKPGDQVGTKTHGLIIERHERRASGKGEPGLLDRRVVRRRGTLGDAIKGSETESIEVALDEVHDAAMGDLDALGSPGGPRGVDHVCEAVAIDGGVPARRRFAGTQSGRAPNEGDIEQFRLRDSQSARPKPAGRIRDHNARSSVLEGADQVSVWKAQIECGVGASDCKGRKLRRVEVWRVPRQEDCDDRFRPSPAGPARTGRGLRGRRWEKPTEFRRQAVDAAGELGVRHQLPLRSIGPRGHLDCGTRRMLRGRRLEERMQKARGDQWCSERTGGRESVQPASPKRARTCGATRERSMACSSASRWRKPRTTRL